MYKRIYYDRNKEEIHLWDDVNGYSKFPYKPYAYQLDDNGAYQSMDGKRLSKITSWNETAEQLGLLYEHDVNPEMRTLIDGYSDSDDKATNIKIFYFDIEVRKNEKYSSAKDALNEVNAITYKTSDSDLYQVLLLNEKDTDRIIDKIKIKVPTSDSTEIFVDARVQIFTDEKNLLKSFLKRLREEDPDILTGWNIDFYDIPYLYYRVKRILDWEYTRLFSPIGIVKEREYNGNPEIIIAGTYSLDYINMYKKFTYSEEPSYALDAIARKELGRGKVEYKGSLDDLWNTDPNKFIAYSVTDVELVQSLDNKLDFIDLAIGLCHKGHVGYDNIKFPSVYIEGAILTKLRRSDLVAISRKKGQKDEGAAEGAFVKMPVPGIYNWIYDLDLTSLYPWNIISLNISPETKFGYVENYSESDFVNNKERRWIIQLNKEKSTHSFFKGDDEEDTIVYLKNEELLSYILENNLSISSAGILYRLDKKGLIPEILTEWFNERTVYKNQMHQYGKEKNTEKEKYFDKKQLVTKILLNSVYGVLLLSTFRFYDKQNGESVTLTGQSVINWSSNIANKFYTKTVEEREDNIKDFCIYTDTDSCRGDSIVKENGELNITIEDLFNKYWEDINCKRLIDSNNRHFIFPDIKLPYYQNNNINLGKVQYVEKHFCKKRQYKLKLKNNKSIIITEDHSVMVYRKNELIQVKPDKIDKNDKFVCLI